jgi:hypothetical protein
MTSAISSILAFLGSGSKDNKKKVLEAAKTQEKKQVVQEAEIGSEEYDSEDEQQQESS